MPDHAKRQERILGGAGELLRAALEAFDFAAQSCQTDSRTTFHGNNDSASLVDYIFAPYSLVESTRSAGSLYKAAKRLQLIHRKGLADHTPVHWVVWYSSVHDASSASNDDNNVLHDFKPNWCYDKLIRGLKEGHCRREFIASLECRMSSFCDHELPALQQQRTTDEMFTAIDRAIMEVAIHFSAKTTE